MNAHGRAVIRRTGILACALALVVAAAASPAHAAQAVEGAALPLAAVTCTDTTPAWFSESCWWVETSGPDKYAALADLLLVASAGVAMVFGFRVGVA